MQQNCHTPLFSSAIRLLRHWRPRLFLFLLLGITPVALAVEDCENPFETSYGCGALRFVDGIYNTGVGYNAAAGPFLGLTSFSYNTAVGALALEANAFAQYGSENTAVGYTALRYSEGSYNAAVGNAALAYNKGDYNTAIGYSALSTGNVEGEHNTGDYNVALGAFTLKNNTDGFYNTATGYNALTNNKNGSWNTADGSRALAGNTVGNYNTAVGVTALFLNTTGNENTGIGVDASFSNTTGNYNTSLGTNSLYYSTTASKNTAIGHTALFNNITGASNTAQGYRALYKNTTGGSNVALGNEAGYYLTTGSNNIVLGGSNYGVAGESNTIRIGTKGTQTATYIAGISGTKVAGGVAVQIDTNGRLGTITSSARYKEAIKPMAKASEAIFSLQPVTFRYKRELDPEGTPQFGLVAEEVAKVDPELVARDEEGRPYTVRYDAVNAMLLNEFHKEHRKVETLEATVARLRAALQRQAEEQGTELVQLRAQLGAIATESNGIERATLTTTGSDIR